MNAIDGQNACSTGNRYLSSTGDRGRRQRHQRRVREVNAFIGSAILSMILHMLSQRSDTDLLSAPKVVTKSGQEAIMKVVTEYIYPTEYKLQISKSRAATARRRAAPAARWPWSSQNFEMREVGVICRSMPGSPRPRPDDQPGSNPQVVSEPVWKNGTQVPKTTRTSATATELLLNPLAASVL